MNSNPPPLFQVLEKLQGDLPWGSVLDAGTGPTSARWIAGLATRRWTAVSADPAQLAETRAALGGAVRPQDRPLAGNWADPALLDGEVHDTVLAEYLVGAMESYAPCFQDAIFARLRPLVGRRLYVIGLDPYVTGQPETAVGQLVQAVGRFRDACHLLAGETPYREFPVEWAIRGLQQAGLRVVFARRFPNRYDRRWIDLQIGTARALIERITDAALAAALTQQAATLRAEAGGLCAAEGGLAHGHDYVIAAEPI